MHKFLLLLWSMPALASTVVYSNFGPTSPGYSSLGEDISANWSFYSAFQNTQQGILAEVILPLYWRASAPPTGALQVDFTEQVFGGSVTRESWSIPSSSLNQFGITEITLNSVVKPTLTAGVNYFLILYVPSTETGTYVWARNTQNDKQGTRNSSSGLTSGAFEITADTAAPEPATWLTLTSAALLVFIRRRRSE